jgi:hypothetical protein
MRRKVFIPFLLWGISHLPCKRFAFGRPRFVSLKPLLSNVGHGLILSFEIWAELSLLTREFGFFPDRSSLLLPLVDPVLPQPSKRGTGDELRSNAWWFEVDDHLLFPSALERERSDRSP